MKDCNLSIFCRSPQARPIPAPAVLATPTQPHPSPSSISSVSLGMSPHLSSLISSHTTATTHQLQSQSGSNLQYSHNSIPISTLAPGMGYGSPAVSGDVICLDSDSESDWAPPPLPAVVTCGPGVGMGTSVQAQATLLPGPKFLTVPFSHSLDHTHSTVGGHTPSTVGGYASSSTQGGVVNDPKFNAAVSHLMQYLKQRERVGESQARGLPSTSQQSFPSSSSASHSMDPLSASHTPLSSGQTPINAHLPSTSNLGQYPGQMQANLGLPSFPISTPEGATRSHQTLSSADSTMASSLPQLSPTMTSLLNSTTNNNIAPSPQPRSLEFLSSHLSNAELQTQPLALTASNTNTSPSGTREAAASLSGLDNSGSPPHYPLFSPPKLPLHGRESAGLAARSSFALQNSPYHPSFSHTPPPPPPSTTHTGLSSSTHSLPCSPPTALTPSPLSQPPTPSTSIPLLSPVAAHFFQISMNKSPKPTPSPSSRTPTPSPSPSSHHHTLTSPPISSPPSVSVATSPVVSRPRPSAPLIT